MKFDRQTLDKVLLICPEDLKAKILEDLYQEKSLCDVKFMTLSEFRKKAFFDYDYKAVLCLKEEFGLSVANAKEILEVLHLVDPHKNYGIEKLDQLAMYRRFLDEKGLLIYDPLFEGSIKDRKILVAGYGKLSKEEEAYLKGEVIAYEKKDRVYEISCFETIEEETAALYETIEELVFEKGIDINRIFVLNVSQDHAAYFRRFNTYYPFTVEVKEEDVLYGTKKAKDFLAMIDTLDRNEIYEMLVQDEDPISSQLISLINRYPDKELSQMKEFIEEDLKNTKITHDVKKDLVRIADIFHEFDEDEYVFLLGYNDSFPGMAMDTGYISDPLAKILGCSITEEKNALTRENVSSYLSNISHLRISYCRKTPFSQYEISDLFAKDEVVMKEIKADTTSYLLNKAKLSYALDSLYRYGIHDEQLDHLFATVTEDDYRSYDNRFDGLRQDQTDQIEKVILSYSSMDTFYKCSFAYYLKNILRIDPFDETFYTKSGTLCHEVLKDFYEEPDFDFETSFKRNLLKLEEAGKGFEDDKERHFALKMKEELKKDIEIIRFQKENGHLDKAKCENEFFTWADQRIGFKGFIDKLLYKELSDEVIVDVIDYKTGNSQKIEEKLMPFGMSLQLPSYMYLLSNSKLFDKKVSFGGFYLQHLINSELKYDEKKDKDQIKEESMRLDGYTTNDTQRLGYLDDTIEEGPSRIIKGLRLKKDGSFYATSKVISDEKIDQMIALVDEKVKNAGKTILNGEFTIDPKEIDGENKSCSYCPYGAICYKRYNDLRRLTTKGDGENG